MSVELDDLATIDARFSPSARFAVNAFLNDLLQKVKTILFLCTGNYYRSRFAEELFNHHAERAGLDWVAQSRGLALERGAHKVGPISHAHASTVARGIGSPMSPAPCYSGEPGRSAENERTAIKRVVINRNNAPTI